MKSIIAVNGSPRKDFNTAKMLKSALEGAKMALPFANTEMIQLSDYLFSGCRSCFCCKLKSPDYYGAKCFYNDALTPVLEKVSQCDVLLLGSPIYLGQLSALMHSFIERLIFPYYTYENDRRTTAPKRMPTALFYSMNFKEDAAAEIYGDRFKILVEDWIELVYSKPQVLAAYNTYQFDDYKKYQAPKFNETEKAAY